jgi:hypothetical protein
MAISSLFLGCKRFTIVLVLGAAVLTAQLLSDVVVTLSSEGVIDQVGQVGRVSHVTLLSVSTLYLCRDSSVDFPTTVVRSSGSIVVRGCHRSGWSGRLGRSGRTCDLT